MKLKLGDLCIFENLPWTIPTQRFIFRIISGVTDTWRIGLYLKCDRFYAKSVCLDSWQANTQRKFTENDFRRVMDISKDFFIPPDAQIEIVAIFEKKEYTENDNRKGHLKLVHSRK
jgi:hypothetical protein